jgi:hypothetical protein
MAVVKPPTNKLEYTDCRAGVCITREPRIMPSQYDFIDIRRWRQINLQMDFARRTEYNSYLTTVLYLRWFSTTSVFEIEIDKDTSMMTVFSLESQHRRACYVEAALLDNLSISNSISVIENRHRGIEFVDFNLEN